MASAAATPGGFQGGAPPVFAPPLSGVPMIVAGIVLALINFVVVLDMTIANVSIPHIAGSMGVTPSAGTHVVTSYSIAEAICVPLTGWLVKRFGAVRCLIVSLSGFGLFSILCGLSWSIGMLVVFRLGQGFCGGPLMPLTQTLLMRVYPPEKRPLATAIWAMTTVSAPIFGPLLGGAISDGWSWHWIFFINVPVVLICLFGVVTMLRQFESERVAERVDWLGIVLLAVWVGSLQLVLDLGSEHDWFHSAMICTFALVAAVGFVAFVIWELTEPIPIVNLRVFRHRGFTMAMFAATLSFGTFFAVTVVLPQWLQVSMGYSATQAGYVLCLHGITAVMTAPFVPRLMKVVDPRLLVSLGLLWMAAMALMRLRFNTDIPFLTIALPQLLQGLGMTSFFIPLNYIMMTSVDPEETASASGLSNFARTLSGAMLAAYVTTLYSDGQVSAHDRIANSLNDPGAVTGMLSGDAGMGSAMLNQMVNQQSAMLSLAHTYGVAAAAFFMAAMLVWLVPKPKGVIGEVPAGH